MLVSDIDFKSFVPFFDLKNYVSYPLINVPIPGNSPQPIFNSSNANHLNKPIACFIQQIVLRTTVHPWDSNLELRDAFRAPLYEVFRILEIIQNYQHLKRYFLLTKKRCFKCCTLIF